MKTNLLYRLEDLMPFPEHPRFATGDWNAVQMQIGTSLPDDYKLFISKYGSGSIGSCFRVYNYLELPTQAETTLTHLRLLQESTRGELTNVAEMLGRDTANVQSPLPFPIYPEPNGLLPWGEADDWWQFFWLTTGLPAQWSVVTTYKWIESSEHYPKMSILEFIVNLFEEGFHKHMKLEPPFEVAPSTFQP